MITKIALRSWSLDPATLDRFADITALPDLQALYARVKGKLNFTKNLKKQRERFYHLMRGGAASALAARQVALALDTIKVDSPSGRRLPNAVIRKIEAVSHGAKRTTMHRHFQSSVDYYQEREEGLVPVYRKMDLERFIEATTRGRPGTVTAVEQRVIQNWADELSPVVWPTLPPAEELERCGRCIGMGRMSWRGSWFGGAEDQLMRALFWNPKRLREYLEANGLKPGTVKLVYKTARNRDRGMAKTHLLTPSRKFAGRLAVIAVMLVNDLVDTGVKEYGGYMWALNRLLTLDARRWLSVEYEWSPGGVTNVRNLLAQDYEAVRGWVGHQTKYPAVYNCEPTQLWPVLEQSAWFWDAFLNVINGRGWGDSQAARYIRGEI